jgi:hypothetical protein
MCAEDEEQRPVGRRILQRAGSAKLRKPQIAKEGRKVKTMLVDNPIINSPFEEPKRHWVYEAGQPVIKEERRPAGYFLRPRTFKEQAALFEEEFVPLELVNTIRERK